MAVEGRIEPLSYAVRGRVVLKYLGQLSAVLALLNVAPAAVSLVVGDFGYAARSLGVALGFVVLGWPLARLDAPRQIQANEALVVVALVFLAAALGGAYPMHGAGLSAIDAVFESVSGVTTTGLTTLASVESRSVGFLFARSWMQWYGGLGVVVFSMVLLLIQPGTPAKRLALTESSEEEDLIGGTRAYARRVLLVYVALTTLGIGLLMLLGVHPFSASVHALSAISTGGFSLYDNSLEELGGWPVQAAAIAIATAGAVSLPLYYRASRLGWGTFLQSSELRALLMAAFIATTALGALMVASGQWTSAQALREAPLLAFSAQTTTGFSSVPVAQLNNASQLALMVSMLIGGSVGSTAGGIKALRLLILLRLLQLLVLRTRLPRHAVAEPRLGGDRLEPAEIERALLLILLFVIAIVLSWLPFLIAGYDPLGALFDVVSATATVGLSAGVTAADLHPFLKGVLCFDMLLGRVEILALLVLLYPGTWFGRRNAQT